MPKRFFTRVTLGDGLRAFGIVLTLLVTILLSGSLAPRVTDAAPLAQAPDYATQAQAIAQAFSQLGLTPQVTDNRNISNSDNYFSVKASRTQSNPTRMEGHFAYIMKDPSVIPSQVAAGGGRTLSLGSDPASMSTSSATPSMVSGGVPTYARSNDATVRLGCGNVFATLSFHYEAELTTKDEEAARAETARYQIQVEQDAENTARKFREALQKLNACSASGSPSCSPSGQSLNVGIGGNYDEDKNLVSVTAGVENRSGVGIGDDYYEWRLDGASTPIHAGKEQKSLQYNTASLADGEHVIVVKVTDMNNNACGTATFKFNKKKAASAAPPPVQPPAAKPPASASGTANIETSKDTKTVKTGDNTRLEISRGEKATLKATCKNLLTLMVLFCRMDSDLRISWLSGDQSLFQAHAAALGLKIVKLNCPEIEIAPRPQEPPAVAMAGSPAIPSLPSLAIPDTAVQLQLELVQGPLGIEIVNDKVAIEVATATSIVTSIGKNAIPQKLLHDLTQKGFHGTLSLSLPERADHENPQPLRP